MCSVLKKHFGELAFNVQGLASSPTALYSQESRGTVFIWFRMNISLLRLLVCLKSKGWQVSGVTSFVDVGTLICNLHTQISVKLLQQWELFKVSRRLF